jgi:O-methyltransferase involved in polyketide biosynthesis
MLQVSDTAHTVSVIRAEERERPAESRLFDDPYATLFCAAADADFTHQLERKAEVLRRGGVPHPAHVAYVPCDFMEPAFEQGLTDRLAAAGFRRGAPTRVVWEGVISYVDDTSIQRTFGFAARVCGPDSGIVFDYSDYRLVAPTAAERILAAGFSAFDSEGLDEAWRRLLVGEPHPAASVVRMGVGRK